MKKAVFLDALVLCAFLARFPEIFLFPIRGVHNWVGRLFQALFQYDRHFFSLCLCFFVFSVRASFFWPFTLCLVPGRIFHRGLYTCYRGFGRNSRSQVSPIFGVFQKMMAHFEILL